MLCLFFVYCRRGKVQGESSLKTRRCRWLAATTWATRDKDRVNNVPSLWAPSAETACDWTSPVGLSWCSLPTQTNGARR